MADDKSLEKLFEEFPPVPTEDWEQNIRKDITGEDYNKKLFWKPEPELNFKPYYRKPDIDCIEENISPPGEYPFIRSNKESDNDWEIRQEIFAEEIMTANLEAVNGIAYGAASICFHAGFLNSASDLRNLFKGIDLEKIPVHFSSATNYTTLAQLLSRELKRQKIDANKFRGSFDFDPLTWRFLRGYYYNSKEDNIKETLSLLHFCIDELPQQKAININGQHFHNAGASVTQELAYSLASGAEYLVAMTGAGLKPEQICSRLQITFAIGQDYFLEIAKIRAARYLWARIAEQFGAKEASSLKVHIHCVTSDRNKTIFDPNVNMLRTTTEAMSAAIGGADSISVNPFDSVFRTPNEFSKRLARNLQNILKAESGLDKVIDPAGGSYYIENLTESLISHSWARFLEIEKAGGMFTAIEKGLIKDQISEVNSNRDTELTSRKRPILGTTIFPNLDEEMYGEINQKKEKDDSRGMKRFRTAEVFEKLRFNTEEFVLKGGIKPRVLTVTYGNHVSRKARANYIAGFFGVAGYEILDELEFNNIELLLHAIEKQKADIVAICSSDNEYADFAASIVTGIKQNNEEVKLIIAGYPKEIAEDLRKAGIDDFIHTKTNLLETLRNYHKLMGIPTD